MAWVELIEMRRNWKLTYAVTVNIYQPRTIFSNMEDYIQGLSKVNI